MPAPTPGRRGPVRGGRFSGLPGRAGACPIQARLLGRRGQVTIHARPAGLLTGCCGSPARPGGRLAPRARLAPARIPARIVRSARGGRRVTPPALAGVRSASLTGGGLARRGGPGVSGGPGVTRHVTWGGGGCVATGPVARRTRRSVPTRRLTRAARLARGRPTGCARRVVAAGRLPGWPGPPMVRGCHPAITGHRLPRRRAGAITGRGLTWRPGPAVAGRRVSRESAPGARRGRVVLWVPGGRPAALARHCLGVLRRWVRPPGQVTGILGSGIDGATRPPPARRLLRALVGHLSPCRASDAILPDRELPHHGAWPRRPLPTPARSSTRAGTFAG